MAKAGAMTQAATNGLTRHGGRLADARAAFPDAPLPWLDLSTGLNPRPWRPAPMPAPDPAPLPDPAALRELERVAAAHFGADPATVAAVPGTEIALRLLPALGLPRPLTALTPCYGTHATVADVRCPFPQADLARGRPGTLLLANPNNPDGRWLDAAVLRAVAEAQRAAGGWLVVDEAFADLRPGDLGMFDPDMPVIRLRSFGKFFGLAGVRLGFVVAQPAIIARVRALTGDWPVNAHALAWGTAAYADAAWIADTRARLGDTAARLDRLLAVHGFAATGACPLFRLVEHRQAPAVFAQLGRAGILVRPFADWPDRLRFGLPGDDAGFDRLDRALAHG
jgi:cobalamin biosynthetic protein CobC